MSLFIPFYLNYLQRTTSVHNQLKYKSLLTISLVVFRIVRPAKSRAQTEIGEFDVSITVYKNVVWLNVSMNEPHLMNTFYSTS